MALKRQKAKNIKNKFKKKYAVDDHSPPKPAAFDSFTGMSFLKGNIVLNEHHMQIVYSFFPFSVIFFFFFFFLVMVYILQNLLLLFLFLFSLEQTYFASAFFFYIYSFSIFFFFFSFFSFFFFFFFFLQMTVGSLKNNH